MTKVKAAIDPNDLPDEIRTDYLKQLGEEYQPTEPEQDSANFFQNKIYDTMRFWSQFTNYSIELDDGSKLKFYRVPATKAQLHAIDQLSATILARYELVKGKKKYFDPLEMLQKQDELERLKIDTYLRMDDTNKPPTKDQINHVANSTDIDGILEACHAISQSKWHEGKK